MPATPHLREYGMARRRGSDRDSDGNHQRRKENNSAHRTDQIDRSLCEHSQPEESEEKRRDRRDPGVLGVSYTIEFLIRMTKDTGIAARATVAFATVND